MKKIKKQPAWIRWLSNEENQEDLYLTFTLALTFFLVNLFSWMWIQSGSTTGKSWIEVFVFIFATIILLPLILVLIYLEIQLTKRNLIKRLIERAKIEEVKTEKIKKYNSRFSKKLKEAFKINESRFGKLLDIEEVDLNILNSRQEFADYVYNNISKKEAYPYYSNKDLVGFVRPYGWLNKKLLKKRFNIVMLSPMAFKKESNFDASFAFNVLVHETCHLFIYNSPKLLESLNKEKNPQENMELLCYYVAKQNKYFKKEYEMGKRLFQKLVKEKIINTS